MFIILLIENLVKFFIHFFEIIRRRRCHLENVRKEMWKKMWRNKILKLWRKIKRSNNSFAFAFALSRIVVFIKKTLRFGTTYKENMRHNTASCHEIHNTTYCHEIHNTTSFLVQHIVFFCHKEHIIFFCHNTSDHHRPRQHASTCNKNKESKRYIRRPRQHEIHQYNNNQTCK